MCVCVCVCVCVLHTVLVSAHPLQALQVCMQGILESLIVIDRLMFLQENRLTPDVIPVFDEDISPRNLAILAAL